MDGWIKETLNEKAAEIDLPAGAWEQVRKQVRSVRQGFWRKYHLGGRLEMVAAVAVFILLIGGVALFRVINPGNRVHVAPPADLSVEERPIAEHLEIGEDLLKLRDRSPVSPTDPRDKEWKVARLDRANSMLRPFGYRLANSSGGTFAIYHDDQPVLTGVSNFSPITISERQENFIFMAWTPADRYWLVEAGGVREWPPAEIMRHRFRPPVYVKNDLVSVEWDDQKGAYIVSEAGRPVFSVPLKKPAFGDEVRQLTSWSGHWVLEVDGDVYIDGQSLRQQLGYDEVFEWHLLDDRPFYLFRAGAHFGAAYDGKVLAHTYDRVLHNLCCEPAMLNPQGNENGIRFYGLRSGTWYQVAMRPASTAP